MRVWKGSSFSVIEPSRDSERKFAMSGTFRERTNPLRMPDSEILKSINWPVVFTQIMYSPAAKCSFPFLTISFAERIEGS